VKIKVVYFVRHTVQYSVQSTASCEALPIVSDVAVRHISYYK